MTATAPWWNPVSGFCEAGEGRLLATQMLQMALVGLNVRREGYCVELGNRDTGVEAPIGVLPGLSPPPGRARLPF